MDSNIIRMEEYLQPRYFATEAGLQAGGLHPEYSHTIMICVDSFVDQLANGRIHSYFFEQETRFRSLDQMLFGIDDILNRANEVQRDTQLRMELTHEHTHKHENERASIETWMDANQAWKMPHYSVDNIRVHPGALASYYLRIVARCNSSMQGVISRRDKKETVPFRSEMELLTLIREDLIAKQAWSHAGEK